MEMRKCDVCGEEYSSTYRSCPFCEENEAIRRGKPIRRHTSDFRNRRGGHALGVLALLLVLVAVGVGAVCFFGDNFAQDLGTREPSNPEDLANQDENVPPPSDGGEEEGGTPGFGGGEMPEFGDMGGMPDFGGSGGSMPSFGGGGGGMPGGMG